LKFALCDPTQLVTLRVPIRYNWHSSPTAWHRDGGLCARLDVQESKILFSSENCSVYFVVALVQWI